MEDVRKKHIRKTADDFRKRCIVSNYGIDNLFKDCEKLGYKLIRYPLDDTSELGFTMEKGEDKLVFVNSSNRLSREIFTLAHEIGHFELHFSDSKGFFDTTMTIRDTYDEKEKEANYFAACLLMPEHEIHRFLDLEVEGFPVKRLSAMDIARIMSEFNVSFDMVLNRLDSLKIITNLEKISLDSEKVEKKVGNLLRSVGGNSKLNEVSDVISIPHEYVDYVIYNYNHDAVPKETVERVLEYYQLTMDDVSDKIEEKNNNIEDDWDTLMEAIEC